MVEIHTTQCCVIHWEECGWLGFLAVPSWQQLSTSIFISQSLISCGGFLRSTWLLVRMLGVKKLAVRNTERCCFCFSYMGYTNATVLNVHIYPISGQQGQFIILQDIQYEFGTIQDNKVAQSNWCNLFRRCFFVADTVIYRDIFLKMGHVPGIPTLVISKPQFAYYELMCHYMVSSAY